MRNNSNLFRVLVLLPLLVGMELSAYDLPPLLDEYGERSALETTRQSLLMEPTAPDRDREIVSLLLAADLAELGFADLATGALRGLLGSDTVGGQAMLVLARLRNDGGEGAEGLVSAARGARWELLDGEDLAEAEFLVARACMRTRRYPEARAWLRQVPRGSGFFRFSRYLLAQTEYALGRTGAALDAASEVFADHPRDTSDRWLQERTAVLVGDMLIDLGRYRDAVAALGWPAAASPFRARAERDAAIARALWTAGDDAGASDAHAALERATANRDREIAAAVASPAETAARAADLERAWPPREIRRERRRALARAARAAYERTRAPGWRRVAQVVWRSLPPVALYELVRGEPGGAATPAAAVDARSRHFFTPSPQAAKLLSAIALASEATSGRGCGDRFARAVAERAGAALVDGTGDPSGADLLAIASECRDGNPSRTLAALRERLAGTVDAEASRLRREVHEQGYRVEEALLAARLAPRGGTEAEGERNP